MSWTRVDDGFADHPKVYAAGAELGAHGSGRVLAIWVAGQCYAARHLTDGFLPKPVVKSMRHDRDPLHVADAMVNAGLWETRDGGYQIHDWTDYNLDADTIRIRRKEGAARLKAWRQKHGRNSVTPALHPSSETHMKRACNANVTSTPYPDPYPLVQEHVQSMSDGFAVFYAAYPKHVAKRDAEKAWHTLAPTDVLQATILADVTRRASTPDWTKERGKYVPLPATYLRGRRWEDEPTTPAGAEFGHWYDNCPHEPKCEHKEWCDAKREKEGKI